MNEEVCSWEGAQVGAELNFKDQAEPCVCDVLKVTRT